MSEGELAIFARSLLHFVERASQKGATPEEIAALPEVAQVLVNFHEALTRG